MMLYGTSSKLTELQGSPEPKPYAGGRLFISFSGLKIHVYCAAERRVSIPFFGALEYRQESSVEIHALVHMIEHTLHISIWDTF